MTANRSAPRNGVISGATLDGFRYGQTTGKTIVTFKGTGRRRHIHELDRSKAEPIPLCRSCTPQTVWRLGQAADPSTVIPSRTGAKHRRDCCRAGRRRGQAEAILVDGNSTDATLITARSCRPDIKIVPQEGLGKGCALRRASGRNRRHHRDDGRATAAWRRRRSGTTCISSTTDTTSSRDRGSSPAAGRWISRHSGGWATGSC